MNHDFSLENQITNGLVQYIDELKTDFNCIKIYFREVRSNKRKLLEVIGFDNFSINLDLPEDIARSKKDFAINSLIGFSYEKKSNYYIYCMKTEDYEIMFKSENFPVISKL